MAVEVERLLVTLEARIGGYLADLSKTQAQTNVKLAALETRYAQFATRIKGSASTAAMGIGSALGGIGAYLGAQAVIEYAKAWTRVTRSLDGSEQAFGFTLRSAKDLTALANDARIDVEAYNKLYIRTAAAIKNYGYEAGTAEKVTSTLAKALKLGGASASEQASTLLQFSQALNKGKLDGDEFRTVMENAVIVQELLAKRLGVTKGEIIKLAAEGKLQLPDLIGAMVDGGAQVERIYRQLPATIDEAFTVLRNSVIQFLGQADQASGASAAIVSGIVSIGQNLGTVAVAAGAILGSATLRMLAFAAATVAAANPLTLIAAVLGGLATAYGVFGDQVSFSADSTISLKDSLAGFLDVAGGDAAATLTGLRDVFQAMREEAAQWGLTWENITGTAASAATALGRKVVELDKNFGGYGEAIVNAFVAANKELADTLGITTAINFALERGRKIAERAERISNERGIEARNYGGRLDDYYKGKITDPKRESASGADPNAKRSEFEREVAQIKKRTAALQSELSTIGQTTLAQEKAKAAAELRAAAEETARRQGRKVTGEEVAAIGVLSQKYAEASVQAQLLGMIQAKRDALDVAKSEISLIGLYGQELDAARTKLELLNAYKKAGVELLPWQEAELDVLAQQGAAVKAYGEAIAEINEASKDALKGFISDLREGKSATEALANALDKLADRFIDAGIDQLVTTLVGGAAGPGSGFASLFGFAAGGVFKPGQGPASLPRFARGGVSKTAAIFGEGPMAEAAVPLPDGRRIPVDLRVPKAANATQGGGTNNITLQPVFNVAQGTPEGIEKLKNEIPSMMLKALNDAFDRQPRFAKTRI